MTEPREPGTEVRDALICPDCGVTYKQLVAMCNRHIRPRSEGPGLDALREALNTCWMELEREHGHSSAWPDDTWPSCLLTHAALRAAHAALAAQEGETP